MSNWQNLNMLEKLTGILEQEFSYKTPEKYGGQPYATAYQLAFDFAERYPDDFKTLGYGIGGDGSGDGYNLPQYIAKNLSSGISAGRITHLEYAFLHTRRMKVMEFEYTEERIGASAPGTKLDVSMYCLK